MWVSGWNDEKVDIYVQNDGPSSYHVVQVGATQTDQPVGDNRSIVLMAMAI